MRMLPCQECRGHGRVTEEYILGYALTRPCGYCDGSGEVTPEVRGAWLADQKWMKRRATLAAAADAMGENGPQTETPRS